MMLWQWGGEKGDRLICYCRAFHVELSPVFNNVNARLRCNLQIVILQAKLLLCSVEILCSVTKQKHF